MLLLKLAVALLSSVEVSASTVQISYATFPVEALVWIFPTFHDPDYECLHGFLLAWGVSVPSQKCVTQ
jgi:hypothetical protein